ncbi:hypothetical protein Misp03_46520 [Microbispora sp. NBRC 16548]|nr:hypothetical protein Misp03_46520 [Microbispora sp. NBRC 16548]
MLAWAGTAGRGTIKVRPVATNAARGDDLRSMIPIVVHCSTKIAIYELCGSRQGQRSSTLAISARNPSTSWTA